MSESAERHDVFNWLTAARASVEAMRDGVLPVTPERLDALSETLTKLAHTLERTY